MNDYNKNVLLILVIVGVVGIGYWNHMVSYEPKYVNGTISKTYIANDGSKTYSDYFIVLDNGITYEVTQEDWGIVNTGDFVELESCYSGTWEILSFKTSSEETQ